MTELNTLDVDVIRSILASNADGIVVTDKDNNIIGVNNSFTLMFGYDEIDVLGRNPRMFKSGVHDRKFYNQLWTQLLSNGYWRGDIIDKCSDGTLLTTQTTITAVYQPGTNIIKNYVSIIRDVTQIRAYEQELKELAFHDPLTGMYNRRIFIQLLEEHMALQRRSGVVYILAMIDLDNFGDINTQYGHHGGDLILKHVRDCMKSVFKRDQDILARLGGDEFMVLLTGIPVGTNTNKLCDTICDQFVKKINEPFTFGNQEIVHISASVGVVVGDDSTATTDDIIDRADKAMYEAKHTGKNNYTIYNNSL